MSKLIYSKIEKCEIENNKLTLTTSRQSVVKDLKQYQQYGWNVNISEDNNQTTAEIEFNGKHQVFKFCRTLRQHKLWQGCVSDVINAVGLEA